MTLGTSLFTFFCGKPVGKDEFGNTYYISRGVGADGKKKRWVAYKGKADPTMVPAIWHGWLHYRTDVIPTQDSAPKYPWLKKHTPNLTGTSLAYLPSGHPLRGGKTPKASGDYESWQP